MPHRAFQEQTFLADRQRAIRESPSFDWVDDAQVYVLDREPEPGDVVTLKPPAILLLPSLFEPDHSLGGVQRVTYPARDILIAETLDVLEDADRWTDETKGAARLRELHLEGLLQLGDLKDGAFRLSGDGHINYVEEGPQGAPLRLSVEDEGRDLCAVECFTLYDIEY